MTAQPRTAHAAAPARPSRSSTARAATNAASRAGSASRTLPRASADGLQPTGQPARAVGVSASEHGIASDRRSAAHRKAAPDTPGDPEVLARALCLRALTKRSQTRKELADLLHAKEIPDPIALAVLDRFTSVGLINDAALAAGYAETRHRTLGLSRTAVGQKLRQRGIEPETVEEAVRHIDREAEESVAFALARKRVSTMQHLDPATKARRLIGMLARKGYSASLSHQVVREVVKEIEFAEE